MRKYLTLFVVLSLTSASFSSFAQDGIGILSLNKTAEGSTELSLKLEILVIMTLISFIPAFVIMCTSFTRIIIVLSILRQAIGLQQSPPNKVLIGLAIIFSILIMRPVWTEIDKVAYQPYANDEITLRQALERGETPLRNFMLAQTQKATLDQVMVIGGEKPTDNDADIPFMILLPAFVLSELKIAFQIGFFLYLPFIVIDLVTSAILQSMGMMMLSPLIVSLPFKLLLFVLLDGWGMLMGSLANSYWIVP